MHSQTDNIATPENYLKEGNKLKSKGKLVKAIEKYSEALKIKPNFVRALNQLSVVYEEQKEFDQGIHYLQRAAKLRPKSSEIQERLARLQELKAEENYSKIWQALNQTTLESLEEETANFPEKLHPNKVRQYFDKTSQCTFINLRSLSEENKQLIESMGLSLTYLKLNLEKLITKDGVADVKISDYEQTIKRQPLMVEEGYIYAICPSTGRTLRSSCSLFYTPRFCFYRFVGNEVFYLISVSIRDYLYFPRAEIIIHINEDWRNKNLKRILNPWKTYLVTRWLKIISYILKKQKEKTAVIVGVHRTSTAHAIWDDLSGLQFLYDTDCLKKIDKFLVNSGSDYYGSIDEIFPEISSDKVKIDDQLKHREEIIDSHYFGLRLTTHFVKESLSKRVYKTSLKKCSSTFIAEVEAAKKKNFPLLWIGFRLGKRTWLSQVEGIANIINKLSEDFPKLGVVFDGISRTDIHGSLIIKPNEEEGIKKEKDTVRKIQSLLSEGIQVYDIIGCPMYEVLVWANAVDLYMAPFGGGLAKIVSIANKPGVLHTNRLAIKREEVFVYSRLRENSALSVVVPQHYIVDAPQDEFSKKVPMDRSYDCDWRGIYEEVYKLASSLKRD